MPVLSTGPGTTQMFHDSLMNEWIMDVEINTLVSESLRGGREEISPLMEMTLNTAMKRGLNLVLQGWDVNWYPWICCCVKRVSIFLLQGK